MKTKVVPNDVMFTEVMRVIDAGGTAVICPKGVSMHPFIREKRDRVVLAEPCDLRKYDVVLAHLENGRYVLHRIIDVDGEDITLMGDGNIAGVERCSRKDIEAKAECLLRNGRTIRLDGRMQFLKAWAWRNLLPIRRYLLAIYRRLYR